MNYKIKVRKNQYKSKKMLKKANKVMKTKRKIKA